MIRSKRFFHIFLLPALLLASSASYGMEKGKGAIRALVKFFSGGGDPNQNKLELCNEVQKQKMGKPNLGLESPKNPKNNNENEKEEAGESDNDGDWEIFDPNDLEGLNDEFFVVSGYEYDDPVKMVEEHLRQQQELNPPKVYPKKNIAIGDNKLNVEYSEHAGKEIRQIPVLNQMDEGNGGGASCGYQVLKNVIVLGCALVNKNNERARELEPKLNTSELTQLFAMPKAIWKHYVISERKIDLVNTIFSGIWRCCVRRPKEFDSDGLNKNKVYGFYKTAVGRLARLWAEKTVKDERSEFHFNEDCCEHLGNVVQELCQKKSEKEAKEYFLNRKGSKKSLGNLLSSAPKIKKYIDFSKTKNADDTFLGVNPYDASHKNLDNLLALKDNLSHFNSILGTKVFGGMAPRNLEGDWLDGDELKNLIKYEQFAGGLKNMMEEEKKEQKKLSWLVYEDLQAFGTGGDPNKARFEKVVKKCAKDPSHVVAFALGTMSLDRKRGTGTSGHWYSLVRARDAYYAMDSNQNSCRLNAPGVKIIVENFEQEIAKALKNEKKN